MDYTMNGVKRMLRTVSVIIRAGLAEDTTPEEKEKMRRPVPDDLKVSGAMIGSIMESGHNAE